MHEEIFFEKLSIKSHFSKQTNVTEANDRNGAKLA